jgi:hypothetical protein
MPIRSEIPSSIIMSKSRNLQYRARCAWGGNHLRRLGPDGSMMRQVSARSSDPSYPIAMAIDGYRPHADPLDAAYNGWWKSVGRPLIPLQSQLSDLTSGQADTLLQDSFNDTDNVLLKNHIISPISNNFWAWNDPNDIWKITSNRLYKNASPDGTTWVELNTNEYDVNVTVYINDDSTFDAGVMVRYVDSQNYLYARLHSDNAGQVDLMMVKNGTETTLATNTAWGIGVGTVDLLVMVRSGNIKILVSKSYSDGIECDTQEFDNATKMGLYCSAASDPFFENLYVWRPFRFYEAFADWSNWTLYS